MCHSCWREACASRRSPTGESNRAGWRSSSPTTSALLGLKTIRKYRHQWSRGHHSTQPHFCKAQLSVTCKEHPDTEQEHARVHRSACQQSRRGLHCCLKQSLRGHALLLS